LTPDAELTIDDGRGTRFSLKEVKLAELSAGALVNARLSVNLKQIQAVHAEGQTMIGIVKAVDPAKKAVTLAAQPGRGEDDDQRLLVSADAIVLVDDGRGRRLSIRAARLADIPVGAAVTVKLGPDQGLVMHLRAAGPTLVGQLKAVDTDKGTITISIPRGRGD